MQWTGEHDEGECRDGMREGWRRDSGDHNKCFQQPILDLFRTGLLCMVACPLKGGGGGGPKCHLY